MEKAIAGGCVSAISVDPFCRKGFSKLPQGEASANRHIAKQNNSPPDNWKFLLKYRRILFLPGNGILNVASRCGRIILLNLFEARMLDTKS